MSLRSEAEAHDREPRTPYHRDLLGSRIGAYRVVGRLGAGGTGEVYEVEHEELGRLFALKVLRADLQTHPETRARFLREPRALATLVSEHVVSIVDCGSLTDGTPYFVMERLYGSDLRRLLNEQRVLPISRLAQLGVDACRGLACAHRQGLVHRDLKPENLFVTTRDDGQDLCKLLDLGTAKSAQDNATRPGTILGTIRYMAPEQLGAGLPPSPQTDLFSLGVVLYECLTGQSPFDGDTVERVMFKIMNERETPIREWRPEVPDALAALVSQALAKNPGDRPSSALSFAEALSAFACPSSGGRPFSSWQLRISSSDVEASSDRNVTPHVSIRSALDITAKKDEAPRGRRSAYLLVLLGLTSGLALGVTCALLFTRRAKSDPDELPAKAQVLLAPVVPDWPAASGPPAALPSATEMIVKDSDASAETNTQRRIVNRKLGVANDVGAARPPPAIFDPRNPYGQ
ncbi:MAG TPA: serine/threonine-protein kinase [Polyangiaceae bacterium]|nr:serine/threonine-protein kinase [Polyangiaceae bacterium]